MKTRIRVRKLMPRARGLRETYAAQVAIPVSGYGVAGADGAVITCGALGFSFGGALRKATSLAKRIAKDPIITSMMPPQVKAGIAAARKLSTAAARGAGPLKKAWGALPSSLKKSTKGLANKMLRKMKLKKKKKRMHDEEMPDEQMPEEQMPDEGMPDEQMPDDAYADNGEEYADETDVDEIDDEGDEQ